MMSSRLQAIYHQQSQASERYLLSRSFKTKDGKAKMILKAHTIASAGRAVHHGIDKACRQSTKTTAVAAKANFKLRCLRVNDLP